MVVDTLKNIEQYKGLSPDIYAGLQFLANAKSEIELGIYQINKNVKAIVSSYTTVDKFERGYESHKNVIDIQYPIIGLERVKWSPIENMNVNIPYDESKDRTFFKDPSKQGSQCCPSHSPQHKVNQKELIKKITIKVSI